MAIRAMFYILLNVLGHLIHVDAFMKVINGVVDLSVLSVIMCHLEHFRVTVLWDAELLLMVAVWLYKVINIIDQVLI